MYPQQQGVNITGESVNVVACTVSPPFEVRENRLIQSINSFTIHSEWHMHAAHHRDVFPLDIISQNLVHFRKSSLDMF